MDEFPALVRVTDCLALLPGAMLPKANAEGFADNVRLWVTPVPVSGTASGDGVALLPIVTVPDVVRTGPGEKRTVSAIDVLGVTVVGKAGPVTLNPVPAAVVCEMI